MAAISSMVVFAVGAMGAPPALPDFTGYVVTAQWDGRTVPTPQWALDVTRQDPEFRVKQELKLQLLIPTFPGAGLTPTYTTYEPISRTYFTIVGRTPSSASLWGLVINGGVNESKMITPETPDELRFNFPTASSLVGCATVNSPGGALLFAVFEDGGVYGINTTNGATTKVTDLTSDMPEATVSTAIATNGGSMLYAIVTPSKLLTATRSLVQFDLRMPGAHVTSTPMDKLRNHNPMEETPFEMLWLESLNYLLVFFTGTFDQLIFVDPTTGSSSFLFNNIAEYEGGYGTYAFTANDYLEDDDMWSDSCIDTVQKKIYFQCTSIDQSSGEQTTTLCEIPIPTEVKPADFINTAIAPMTYGYAGMEFVEVAP